MDWLIHIITVTEILGTVAFAISGAMVAVKKRMDILGVIVLGVITAVGGGVIRDLLLGITPPTAFQNPVYVAWAFVTSIIVFVMVGLRWDEKSRKRFDMWLNMADALGLGIFASMGVRTAISCGYADNAFLSVFVGVLTGVGGGMLRDSLAGEVPKIFRKRIYAVAALAGAVIYYCIADRIVSQTMAILLASTAVVCIRLLATHYEWDLPRARYEERTEEEKSHEAGK